MRSLGLYIHIPFCKRKCNYCDFYSLPTSDTSLISSYVDALCSHIRLEGKNYSDFIIDSIFFGGGTPSLLSEGELTKIALALGISERVHLLGYREDVAELYHIADVFAHPSYREGLPVSVMEAMASGLPIVASKIRGNVDLIMDGGGYLAAPNDACGFGTAILTLLSNSDLREKMGAYNRAAAQKYSYSEIEKTILDIYG